MSDPRTPNTPDAGGEFSSIEDALGSYVEDDQDDGQGGQSDAQNAEGQGDPGEQQASDDIAADDQGNEETELELEPEVQEPVETFVEPTAKVKLPDGTAKTVAELMAERGQVEELRTRVSQIDSERAQVESVKSQVRDQYNALQEQREYFAAIAQAVMPQRPDPSLAQTDLQAYTILDRAYQETVAKMNQLGAQYREVQAQQEAEQKEALKTYRKEQGEKLVKRAPEFAKDEYYRTFWNEAISKGGQYYGYTPDELSNGMNDHRQYLVFRDALAYRRIKANQGKAKNGQPANGQQPQRKVMTGSGRPADANTTRAAQAKARFLKNPSLKTAMDLDI